MIVFDLRCGKEHVFEAWFKDSETFEAQAEGGEVVCPVCGDTDVGKSLMAPRLSGAKHDQAPAAGGPAEQMGRFMAAAREIRRHVEENCENVGERFAEEALKIHNGETESRGIYGAATDHEAETLNDEGVEFQRIPWGPREDA